MMKVIKWWNNTVKNYINTPEPTAEAIFEIESDELVKYLDSSICICFNAQSLPRSLLSLMMSLVKFPNNIRYTYDAEQVHQYEQTFCYNPNTCMAYCYPDVRPRVFSYHVVSQMLYHILQMNKQMVSHLYVTSYDL